MRDHFDARVRQARWAVRLWEAFPVSAAPRPVVLVAGGVTTQPGFRSTEAKLAFMEGLIDWAVEVPGGVRATLENRADRTTRTPRPRRPGDDAVERARRPLKLSHAGEGEREFLTDRGARTLPAWWVQGPQTIGPIWVLDPGVEPWEPARDAGPAPPAPTQGQPMLWPVELYPDGRSILIPWLGSHAIVERFPRARLIETPTAVSAVAVREDMGFRGAVTAVGLRHDIPARLRAPLGNRVFVDLHGNAVQVTAAP